MNQIGNEGAKHLARALENNIVRFHDRISIPIIFRIFFITVIEDIGFEWEQYTSRRNTASRQSITKKYGWTTCGVSSSIPTILFSILDTHHT